MSYFKDVDPDVQRVIDGVILATQNTGFYETEAGNIMSIYLANGMTSLDCANQLAALAGIGEN